ncbi:recombinase family protein [Flavobacterium celericrescens]|uniref:Recombinase family protein n=1 Tax=Flavobacterium celericrescens TaxID=2709780 RepID=A0ABX0ICE4_9FLAO|nr:recombinase family protein [Flavobacterium celericrescens]NHM04863.1 recombinase family protein [Flavobacterium celericrescens]
MKYISYYRVSTKKQEKSGLGLDAQKTAVQNFLDKENILIAEYQEAESGKDNQRPQLLRAIEHCKSTGAVLLIAKLDRLSRNAAFILTLRDSKIEFVCADMPTANSVTIGIMAILAQDERERISQRTKVALAELKARGINLGSPQNLTNESRTKSIEVRRNNALEDENNRKATAMIVLMKDSGKSLYFISNQLNENGFKTRNGKEFNQMTVKRLYDRYVNNK